MKRIQLFTTIMVCSTILLLSTSLLWAASQEVAFVLKVNGDARIKKESANWATVTKGMRLHNKDIIKTGTSGLVALVFLDDKTMMKIRSDSEVQIRAEKGEKGVHKRILMEVGEMWSRVIPGKGTFRLETPSGVAAVKGTEFYGIADADGNTTIIGIEGLIEFFNDLGKILVVKGTTGQVSKNGIPQLFDSADFEDWAQEDEINELDIEFENNQGSKKHLKLKYKMK